MKLCRVSIRLKHWRNSETKYYQEGIQTHLAFQYVPGPVVLPLALMKLLQRLRLRLKKKA
jgi:hypothetical protein